MIKFVPLLVIILFLSCNKKEKIPQNIIQPEKMENVFWDYLRADAYSSRFKKDSGGKDTSLSISLQNTIFRHYKISKETFYKSYNYYMEQRPEMMQAIIDSMMTRQQKKTPPAYKKDIKLI